MIEIIIANLPMIVSIIGTVIGTIIGMKKYYDGKIKDAFTEGKAEEICLNKIENKAEEALIEVKNLEKKLDTAKERGDEHHDRLYAKLDRHNNLLTDMNASISYIKGKLENINISNT